MRVALPSALMMLFSTLAGAQTPPAEAPVETITSEAPKTPLEKAIAGFVKSQAAPTASAAKIPRWAQGVCPATFGLAAEQGSGVDALIRQVAAKVGAPAAAGVPCRTNVMVIFTRTPQAVLDDIAKNHEDALGYHEVSQTGRIATMRYPVQAWYATATRSSSGTLSADSAQQSPRCADADTAVQAICGGQRFVLDSNKTPALDSCFQALQNYFRYCGGTRSTGSRVADGLHGELAFVTIIADANRLGELGIRPVANYVAMLALSQTQVFDACQPLASIVNLMTPGCDAALKPQALSQTDFAYLTALYRMNPDALLAGQQSSIAHQMETALEAH